MQHRSLFSHSELSSTGPTRKYVGESNRMMRKALIKKNKKYYHPKAAVGKTMIARKEGGRGIMDRSLDTDRRSRWETIFTVKLRGTHSHRRL